MSAPGRSSSARLWWAAPSALAVVGALAFAVGFAPRLAQRVRLPTTIIVAAPDRGAQDPVAAVPPGGPAAHPRPAPAQRRRTLAPAAANSGGGTVVLPARPVVTARPTEDGTWQDGSAPPGGSPNPNEPDRSGAGGDG